MNTLSIPTTMTPSATTAPALKLLNGAIPRRPDSATWLPAPAPRLRELRQPACSRRTWITPPKQSPGEKAMLALLAGASLSGIAYGFVCLLNLVQNWAVFHSGITKLIQ